MLLTNKMAEYNNSSVSAGACAYATLSHYNNGSQGLNKVPVPRSTVSGVYVVPTYGAPGYNTLTHGNAAPSCSGFFNIGNAYGKGANNCNTQFVKRLCQ